MTMINRMALGLLLMLLLLFSGTYIITLHNARGFLIEHIENNTQYSAIDLGLSLSQELSNHNPKSLDNLTQSSIDTGNYSSILVKDNSNHVLVSKVLTQTKNQAPKWFINLIQWPVIEKSSALKDKGTPVGTVSITSNPSDIYLALWHNALGMACAYIIITALVFILFYAFARSMLKPLKRVTAQALAISAHEFPIETKIPRTPELKQVTLAMNQMVLKIKSLFQEQLQQTESLRVTVYQDSLTGLSNRRYFLQQISSILDSEDEFIPGYVLMIVVDGLDELNQQCGYQQGDNMIIAISNACKNFWKQSTVNTLARINGSTFAIINNERNPLVFEELCRKFEHLLRQSISDVTLCEVHLGAVGYFAHQSVSNLLTMVDASVKKARETGSFYSQREHESFKLHKTITMEDIEESLEKKNFALNLQSVTDGIHVLHKEIYVRIKDFHGEAVGAGYFMPIAEQLGVAHKIDQYVLKELASKEIATKEEFALNLSADTITNKANSESYLQLLKTIPSNVVSKISLEISETLILSHFAMAKEFTKQAKNMGVSIGVDRVGVQFSPLHYLSDFNIDYIKLHGSLIQDIEQNESKQFFIHYFNEMAKTLDIEVVATQVEEESQWQALQVIHIHWGQGRFLGSIDLLT